jgi:hypothetical protein
LAHGTDVLKITTATSTWVRKPTWCYHAIRTGLEDLDGVASADFGRFISEVDRNEFAGNCVADKDNSPVIEVTYCTTRSGALESDGYGENVHPSSLLRRA